MGVKAIQCFIFFLLGFFFSNGTFAEETEDRMHILSSHPTSLQIAKPSKKLQTEKPALQEFEKELTFASPHKMLISGTDPEPQNTMPRMDVVTPIPTVPIINPPPTTTSTYNPLPTPSNPTPMMTPVTNPVTNPYSTPTVVTPTSSSGQSWCVARQSAPQTALQVALDYACGYGGADCSVIQQGGSCFNPDTVHDHASYAFNDYYKKNPVLTSCDFGGTAVITNTDPSISTCQYPSTSTSSSTLDTTNPTGSAVFRSSPPNYSGSNSSSISTPSSFTLICLLISLVYLKVYK